MIVETDNQLKLPELRKTKDELFTIKTGEKMDEAINNFASTFF